MSDEQAKDVLSQWQENSAYWTRYARQLHSMLAPVTQALIEEAHIREGQSVLDVAGGAGEPSLSIARVVGNSGSVMCTDAIAEMLEAASASAQQHGLANIQFRQCQAQSLPFSDNQFDTTVCRLGVMFFPEPVEGLSEMLRVTKPGGTVSLVVWGQSEVNPFCNLPSKVMSRYVETTPAGPDAPGAFRFAEPGALTRLLSEAGAIEVRERVLEFNIAASLSGKEFWELRSQTSGTLRNQLASLSPLQVQRIAAEVIVETRDFFRDNAMSFPAVVIIATGHKARV